MPQATPPRPRSGWRRWHWAPVVLALIALVIWLGRDRWREFGFQWDRFAASFLELELGWLLAAVASALLTYYGRAIRWAVMLKPLTPRPNIWRLFKATAIGFTAVVLLGRPGEIVRPYLISVNERVSFSSQLAAWFLERLWDLLAVLLLFGFALTQIQAAQTQLGPQFQWILKVGGYLAGALGITCVVFLIAFSRFSDAMRHRLMEALTFLPPHHHQRADRFLSSFLEGTASTQRQRSVLLLFLYTVIEWCLITMCVFFVFQANPATAILGIRELLILLGFIAFGSILQIPGIGGGVQIVTVVVLTELFGIGLEVATGMAILLWFTTFVTIVPFGLLLAFHEGLNWRRLKEIRRDAATRAESATGAVESGEAPR